MNNVPEIKIGILVGSADWMPSEMAIEKRTRLVETYIELYGGENIYECPICITDNEINIKRAIRDIQNANCNAICLYFANYGPESAGTLFAQKFNGPVLICGAAEEGSEPFHEKRTDSLSGVINANYASKLRNGKVFIPDSPIGTIMECASLIHEFLSVARALIGIEKLKLISIGPRPATYLASCAPNYPLYNMGIDISEYSELELYDSYNKHSDDKRIDKVADEMKGELEAIASPDILKALAQYEITLVDWVRSHKGVAQFVTLTSTCWPAFPSTFGFVPCYVNSRMAGRGIPVACEVDEYGAVSEYIGQCVSNDIVTILNINNNIPQLFYDEKIKGRDFNGRRYDIGDLFLGYHCGVTSSSKLKTCKLDYHFVNRQLIGEKKSKGTIQGNIEYGPITLFRLQCTREGSLQAYVAQGQILPVELDTYGGRGIIAVPGMRRFYKNVILEKQYPNHCTVIFGHHAKTIIEVLKMLGISDIDYNHPPDVPYDGENFFATYDDWY